MTENDQIQCKVLAFLLEYPDTSWSADLADMETVVDGVADEQRRAVLRGFLAYAGGASPMELQEAYTQAFDLDAATSLHLTYHLMGDSEDRGKALAALLWVYHREGFDAAIGELPDYLPMMLEFLAVCPEPKDAALLWSCLGTVALLAQRLEEKQHPYAKLMGLAADILRLQTVVPYDKRSKEV
jgi:nitrate reductase molybdenum cofactor assembly chaperone NarJ/NarW